MKICKKVFLLYWLQAILLIGVVVCHSHIIKLQIALLQDVDSVMVTFLTGLLIASGLLYYHIDKLIKQNQLLIDLPQNLISFRDPENNYISIATQAINDNKDDVKMQLILAHICASCIQSQKALELLIIVLYHDRVGDDVMQIFFNRLAQKFDARLDPYSIGSYFEGIMEDGGAFSIKDEDMCQTFFRRLAVAFIIADVNDNEGAYYCIGESIALYLKDYLGVTVVLSDAVDTLFNNFVKDRHMYISPNNLYHFLNGLHNKVAELTSAQTTGNERA